jgi:putative heme transporter
VLRVLQVLLSLTVVLAIFLFAIPRIVDYSAVWATIADLTWFELLTLLSATVLSFVVYWPVMLASMPGLTLGQAAVNNQTTTSIANTLPGGGAIAVGVSFAMYRSWGFTNSEIALTTVITGAWNTLVKLALPPVALALLALQGKASAALLFASLIGLAVLVVALTLVGLTLWRKEFARTIGSRAGQAMSALRRVVRKPPVLDWGEEGVRFRKRAIGLLSRRWLPVTVSTLLSHLALYLVLLLAVRHVGISENEVSAAQVLGVFAFARLVSAVPITPGGLGLVELSYIGGLVLAGRDRADVAPEIFRAQVAAAVLVFRMLTYGFQIPLGGFTYVIWRRMKRWRKRVPVKPQDFAPGSLDSP